MDKIKFLFISIIICTNIITASGNKDDLELGTAIYCDLNYSSLISWAGLSDHWHAGLFQYFEYLSNGKGRMRYTIMKPYEPFSCENCSQNHNVDYTINLSSPAWSLQNLKDYFKADFNLYSYDFSRYQGAYSRNNILPTTRASIAGTANNLGSYSIDYTFTDMLDVKDTWCGWGWCEDWNGEIYRIDELRCDGIVEYSYEKNGVLVTKTYSAGNPIPQYDNIATPNIANVNMHNSLHDGTYQAGEICPRIQAGEDHRGNSSGASYFDPLTALDPEISNFSKTQLYNKIQLNFKVADNASVKAYVLIQVKKTSESTWHTLIDKDDNLWKFRTVDLTDWNGSIQSDYFHIPWKGRYEGGQYFGDYSSNYDMKISVIDQGANHSEEQFNFNGMLPGMVVNITGPTSVLDEDCSFGETRTYTANAMGGFGFYSYKWYDKYGWETTWYIINGETNAQLTYLIEGDIKIKCSVESGPYQDSDDISIDYTHIYNTCPECGACRDEFGNCECDEWYKKNAEENVEIELPKVTKLAGNYPNPFNPSTTIKYQLKENGYVTLIVYDILGRVVTRLVDRNQIAGFYNTHFDASSLASGLYIYRLCVNGFVESKKMLLMK